MKDYKRLTKENSIGRFVKCDIKCSHHIDGREGCDFCCGGEYFDKFCCGVLYKRLQELEDKIESGKLCDREEARKETAREILKSMLNKMYKLTGCGVPYHVKKFMEEIAMECGVELFGNSDRVEDEE